MCCRAARVIDGDRLQAYMLHKLHQELQDGPIVILYFHTCVQSGDNSPGILTLRRIYESLPQSLKLRLEAVYIVHPGIRSRLLLATLGRFFLSEGYVMTSILFSVFKALRVRIAPEACNR
jgi:hypothetical protein